MTDARSTRADLFVVTDLPASPVRATAERLLVVTDVVPPAAPGFEGIQRFRLMIEGWPDEFVTDPWITHAYHRDGRSVNGGLLYQGLRLDERIIMQEAKIEAQGITFKIRPTDHNEVPLRSFTTFARPVASLAASATADATSMSWAGSFVPVDDRVYHIGTEAVRFHTSGSIVDRHIWDTIRQSHNIEVFDQTTAVKVYEKPPAMEGRRCYLYAYGEFSDPASDGFLVWTGVVAIAPQLDRDGVTWSIQCMPITQVLQQSVAGFLQEAHPIGIYNHGDSSFAYAIVGPVGGLGGQWKTLTGFYESERAFIDAANATFETQRAAQGLSQIVVGSIVIEKASDTGWRLALRTSATIDLADMIVGAVSPSIGATAKALQRIWIRDDGKTYGGGVGPNTLAADRAYYADFVYDDPYYYRTKGLIADYHYPISPLGLARNLFLLNGAPDPGAFGTYDPASGFDPRFCLEKDPTTYAANPPWRIYVDADLTGATAVVISDSLRKDAWKVTAAQPDAGGHFYIEVEPWSFPVPPMPLNEFQAARAGFAGFIGPDTKINVVRTYVDAGNTADFAQALADKAVDANDGDTPFITDKDLALPWTLGMVANLQPQLSRIYRFTRALQVESLLQEELKFANHFMRLEIDGRIGILPLPDSTELALLDTAHVIDASSIITPADNYGAWPGWMPQRDGLVTAVELATGYNAETDSFDGAPVKYQDPDAVAKHKTRGKVQAQIEPKAALVSPIDQQHIQDALAPIAAAFLAAFAQDYYVVTVEVPLKHFSVLCGDVVAITSQHVPAGDGTRGVVARRGVVVGRRWNLDAAQEKMGELDVRIDRNPPPAYAPSAYVSSQVNTTGNTWAIHSDAANFLNRPWSMNGDGKVLQHFAVSDKVRVCSVTAGFAAASDVLGTVSVVDADAGDITIVFDSPWVPGTDEWVIEFQADDSGGTKSTDHQKAFTYVADGNFYKPASVFTDDFR